MRLLSLFNVVVVDDSVPDNKAYLIANVERKEKETEDDYIRRVAGGSVVINFRKYKNNAKLC